MSKIEYGTPISATTTHASSAVATVSGVTEKTHYITDIAGSSDKAGALLLVKQGSTVIFQLQIGTTAFEKTFATPLKAEVGADVSVTVDGTSACKANLSGYTI